MYVKKITPSLLLMVLISVPLNAGKKRDKYQNNQDSAAGGTPVLWRMPDDLADRNLFYGPGGAKDQPHGTFTFVKEDLDGTNPKFVVRDQDGVKWKVKLGQEARPETAASRIVWAAGYFTNDDYFVADLHVQAMPQRLHRGWKLVDRDGTVHNVRMKRELPGEKKIGTWKWRDNPFVDAREWNGLKLMMALINNWDLKDENNAIYKRDSELIYMVSDLGASFGTAGRYWPPDKSKGNLEAYRQSQFIREIESDWMDFRVPARPRFVYILNPKEYIKRIRLESIGNHVPRADAKWIGGILARVSPRQIRDAFRAAGYSPQEVEGFAAVVEKRISTLTDL
jgi:hypothetical protein